MTKLARELSPTRARQLDELLNGLATGRRETSKLDPELTSTARRLWDAAHASAVEIGRFHAAPTPAARSIDSPRRTNRPVSRRVARGWAGLQWATTVVMLLAVLGGTFALASRPGSLSDAESPTFDLLRSDSKLQQPVMIDPLTLADLPTVGVPLATPGPREIPQIDGPIYEQSVWFHCTGDPELLRIDWRLSDDVASPTMGYTVLNGRTGEELSRFAVQTVAYVLSISDNCRRLVLADQSFPPVRWFVYEPIGGALITMATAPENSGFDWGAIDSSARRAYRLVLDDESLPIDPTQRPAGPYATDLSVFDLDSSTEVARVDLPGLMTGTWRTPTTSAGRAGGWSDNATVALSPDGTQLAIIHPAGTAITLVDTRSMTVMRTIDVGSLPATPIAAATPPATGTDDARVVLDVSRAGYGVYSPDGGSLYVSGYDIIATRDNPQEFNQRSLYRLDLPSGQVAASTPEGAIGLIPSPDGQSLYAFGPPPEKLALGSWDVVKLRRLDADSLAVEAERVLPEGQGVLLLPRP
jgi:hypothetical protein